MNSVVLAGRLTHEPELKTTPTGVEVTNFRIAVKQEYVKNGEEEKADFFDIVAWRQTAAFVCRYFNKGSGITLKGKLQSRTYQAKDGSNRYVVEVVADSVEFPLGGGEKENNQTSNNTYVAPPATVPVIPSVGSQKFPIDDDLPF